MHEFHSQRTPETPWQVVEAYHEATKHHFHRYARSAGRLDWANQPEPFRRFAGAEFVQLPLSSEDRTPQYDRLFEPGTVTPREVDRQSIGELFEYSLAVTAWKAFEGERWALRANPSSGNLHPAEGYLVLHAVEGVGPRPGVYHYAPEEHGLERRTEFADDLWNALIAGFPEGSFLVGLSDIHWREAWKYGERAYRYCQLDLGHALACLRIAAATLGWQLRMLEGIADAAVARLLGLDRAGDFPLEDREVPALLAAVLPGPTPTTDEGLPTTVPQLAIDSIGSGRWQGKANRLSPAHVRWEIIDSVSAACVKPVTHTAAAILPNRVEVASPRRPRVTAGRMISRRRSAQAMDGRTTMPRAAFYSILARLIPARDAVPWDAVAWQPYVSPGLFVHRVEDMKSGLYVLARDPLQVDDLRDAMQPEFAWERPESCPEGLEFYLLAEGDLRQPAAELSCRQEIAGNGVFSVAMLADWQTAAARNEGWLYRRIFWEAGMIGQVLYLEAEAVGMRGTGIGCFFDDPVHEIFGIAARQYQSLYHFTVGKPVEDTRLTMLPAYDRR